MPIIIYQTMTTFAAREHDITVFSFDIPTALQIQCRAFLHYFYNTVAFCSFLRISNLARKKLNLFLAIGIKRESIAKTYFKGTPYQILHIILLAIEFDIQSQQRSIHNITLFRIRKLFVSR